MSELAPHGDWVTAGKLRPLLAPRGRATQRKIARVSVGDAHTKAVPLDAGLRSRRGNVIAPAIERARFIASPHAAKVAHETSPASRQSATLKHEGSQTAHEKARVAPAKPATPARERHAAPAPRVEAVRPPHVTSSARQAPPPEAAPQGEKHKPDAAPPQGGKAQLPKKEHGREKAE